MCCGIMGGGLTGLCRGSYGIPFVQSSENSTSDSCRSSLDDDKMK